jgi:hypothetical protein
MAIPEYTSNSPSRSVLTNPRQASPIARRRAVYVSRAVRVGRTLERFHQGPGQILEFWVLDVDGTRILIEATRFPDSPPEHVAELQAILGRHRRREQRGQIRHRGHNVILGGHIHPMANTGRKRRRLGYQPVIDSLRIPSGLPNVTSSGTGPPGRHTASNATTDPNECPINTLVSGPRCSDTRACARSRSSGSRRYRVTWNNERTTNRCATAIPNGANHRSRTSPANADRATFPTPCCSPPKPASRASSASAVSRSRADP